MTLGDLTKAINSQNVRLDLGANEIITLFNIILVNDAPVLRINSRSGAADFPSNPLIQVTADAIVSKDVFTNLTTLNTIGSRGTYPLQAFTIIGQNIDGSSGDDITIGFSAIVPHMESLAAERGAYTVRFTLRIANSTYIVS